MSATKKISAESTRKQLAAIVVDKLQQHHIGATLVGGSVVSIYTDNKYESNDLDFISPAAHSSIKVAMEELGFFAKGKDYQHPDTQFTIEFPSGPIGIGDDVPIKPEGSLVVDGTTIVMLSPTQSVMDRLAWFFFSNDRQCLDQAIWVAQKHAISFEKVEAWAKRERQLEKYNVFIMRLKSTTSGA